MAVIKYKGQQIEITDSEHLHFIFDSGYEVSTPIGMLEKEMKQILEDDIKEGRTHGVKLFHP